MFIPTEDEEQITVFEWAELNLRLYPVLALMYHVPNGGKRSKSEAARFKAMGVKSGVSAIKNQETVKKLFTNVKKYSMINLTKHPKKEKNK